MNRKTLIAGLVFAGLILATVLLLRSPEKGNRPAEGTARPIAKITADSFDTLEVTKNKVTTVLKKEGDTYKIVKPMAYPADKDAAKLAFESLTKVDFGNIVSDQKSRQASSSWATTACASRSRRAKPLWPTCAWARPRTR
jgi:hypothetical protein